MWRKEAIPQQLKDASIIYLFKRKGSPQLCDKHRGISLLSVAGKVLARVLLYRLNEHIEQVRLLVRLFDLCLFGFVGFLFLLGSGKGCGL